MVTLPVAAPEMVRKAFKQARPNGRARRSSCCPRTSPSARPRARRCGSTCRRPVAVRGSGASGGPRAGRRRRTPWCWRVPAWPATARSTRSIRFSERLNLPVATTFLGKGVFPDDHPNALGTIGFMVKDYANFGFDRADVVVAVGYDLVEYSPERWNPNAGQADHPHPPHGRRGRRELHARGRRAGHRSARRSTRSPRSADMHAIARRGCRRSEACVHEELERGAGDDAVPVWRRQRIVHDIRAALGDEDIVLCDTGAVKMWMARLYPTYRAQHVLDLQRPGDDGVLAARARSPRSWCTPSGGCSPPWATARS